MSDLPAAFVEHVVAPRGIGDLDDAHAVGEAGSMIGGLGVRVSLAYEDEERIHGVRGRAFASPAPLAPLSWLATWAPGRTHEEAAALEAAEMLAGLGARSGALAPAVTRAAEFTVRALRRALGVAPRTGPADPQGGGVLVCRCLGVGDRTIRAAIRAGAHDPEAIGDATKACTGCRSCRPDLLTLIDEERAPQGAAPAPEAPALERIALARLLPPLRALGMPLLAVRSEAESLLLRLGPPAEGAPISPVGAVAIARHVLLELLARPPRVALEPAGAS